ncbi:MAG TPA: hypothetical protein VGH79_02315 [Gaiellaceae bacterium]|jgi:hypothetical protein
MFRGLRWIALAGVVAAAALIGPGSAFADCGGGSAVSIYSETTCPANGKAKSTGQHHAAHPTAPSTQPTYPTYPTQPTTPVAPKTKKALHHAGHAKKSLKKIIKQNSDTGVAPLKLVPAASSTALGSQFDLGSGPTFLVVLLLGTVLVLLGTGGVRAWRNRHRS